MANERDPIVGNWYRHLDKGQMFRVIAFDEVDAVVELQHFDGDIEGVDLTAWRSMDLEIVEAPEDWTGPTDDIEKDDLDYTETDMSEQDWSRPLEETRREETETGERTRSREEDVGQGETPSTEELWEPAKIEGVPSDSGT